MEFRNISLARRVDVLDACPKAEGMMMMIRSMSPDVLIVDEIGRKKKIAKAIMEAVNAGISFSHKCTRKQLSKKS